MSQDPNDTNQNPLSETDDKYSDLKETVSAQPEQDTRGMPAFQEEGSGSGQEIPLASQESSHSEVKAEKLELSADEIRDQAFDKIWHRLQDHLTEVEANMQVNVSERDKKLYYILWVSQANAIFRRLGTLRKRRSHPLSSKCG